MKTLPSNAWLQRDLGFLHWVDDASRCKRLLGSVVVTFMDVVVSLFYTYLCISVFLLQLCSHTTCLSLLLLYYVKFRGSFLKLRYAALDSDDLLYLKEQMEAEEDAERLLRRTEKRAFAAFKRAASLADSSPASVPLPFRVEPKPKSGIRQQDLLKKVVEIKPKRPRTNVNPSFPVSSIVPVTNHKLDHDHLKEKEQFLSGPKLTEDQPLSGSKKVEEHRSLSALETEAKPNMNNSGGGLLGLAYTSSDDEE
ncbi:unnamed protein product [Lupinus luteus]|uniref:Uncharacterized protein n=1 Tax=Lupinus luteus TaxID=3873 RepID=A0AAV1YF23_LUPLU